MNQADSDYSTQQISPALISQIIEAIKNKAYGSVEIYVENHTVTQITERTINKVCKPVKNTKTFTSIKTAEESQLPAS
jgi:hypothetical protein